MRMRLTAAKETKQHFHTHLRGKRLHDFCSLILLCQLQFPLASLACLAARHGSFGDRSSGGSDSNAIPKRDKQTGDERNYYYPTNEVIFSAQTSPIPSQEPNTKRHLSCPVPASSYLPEILVVAVVVSFSYSFLNSAC